MGQSPDNQPPLGSHDEVMTLVSHDANGHPVRGMPVGRSGMLKTTVFPKTPLLRGRKIGILGCVDMTHAATKILESAQCDLATGGFSP